MNSDLPTEAGLEIDKGSDAAEHEERWRLWLVGVALTLTVAVAVGAISLLPPVAAAGRLLDDLVFAGFAPAEPPHPKIAIVAVTDDTLADLRCRSPIDRRFLADLIDTLVDAGVDAIGLDLLLDQPTIDESDAALQSRLRRPSIPIVAISAAEATPLSERQREHLAMMLEGVAQGHANLLKDPIDGVVRRHMFRWPDGQPSFAAAIASAVGAAVPDGVEKIAWHGRPADGSGPFPIYEATSVPLLPKEWLRGRIVLVGVVTADADRHRTPLSAGGDTVPGVEIQAHALAQLLDGRTSPIAGPAGTAIALLAATAGGSLVAASGLGLGFQFALGLLGVLTLGIAIMASVAIGGPLLPFLPTALASMGGLGATSLWLHRRERGDRRVLMQLFARHVSQAVAERIWIERRQFLEGGRPRPQALTASVMFSDVEGFTTISERLDPEALLEWLETYQARMVEIVGAHGGVVNRFIGDGLLAAFGVPIARRSEAEISADARASVAAAIDMAAAVDELNQAQAVRGLPPIGVRIGILTGPLIVGSIGGTGHMEYTLLGDTANTAARLEAYAKSLRSEGRREEACTIIVGEPTWERLSGRYRGAAVGALSLRGKSKTVLAYVIEGPVTSNAIDESE